MTHGSALLNKYHYFVTKNFNYHPCVCNGCHNLLQNTKVLDDAFTVEKIIIEIIFGVWLMLKQ